MRLQSLRQWILVLFMALVLAAPASSAWLSSSLGVVVAPAGSCEDAHCQR